ncbi:ankyrin repeat protein [Dactylonectria estremocensis]|uniref:Ankyrin repeat protein n=1 Tax=Dactylonectria estremocensis TaxID=1079267 RepID=A0A9P9J6W0_9HYPO|nr:ankyrin repeat protein [Dactylonectria estremocensis]
MPRSTPSLQAQLRDAHSSPKCSLHSSIREGNLAKLQQLVDSLNPADLRQHLDKDDGHWGKPLHAAVICNDSAAVAILLTAGASPFSIRWESDDAPTPLAIAARQGNRPLLRQLWQYVDPDLHPSNHRGFQSCLISAALHGQASIVIELLDWWDGWSLKVQDLALSSGTMMWHVYVVEVLLSRFSFNQLTLDRMLYLAVEFKSPRRYERIADCQGIDYFHQQRLIALLVDAGANPNTTLNSASLVHLAASYLNLVGALKALLEMGADPNRTNRVGDTALHHLGFPIRSHPHRDETALHETGIRLLLGKGASVCQQNDAGETPLHHAACGSNPRILQLLLSTCSSEEERNALVMSTSHHGEGLLHFAAAGCKIDIIEHLFSHAAIETSINSINSNGWTPLMCALTQTNNPRSGYEPKTLKEVMPSVQLLLAHGAESLVVTAEGWTPLHCLALYSEKNISDETIKLIDGLVTAGADVNARALFPVELPPSPPGPFRFYGHSNCGYRVAQAIEDPTKEGIVVQSGLTPLHFAAAHGALGVVEALLRHGADPAAEDSNGASPARTAGESMRTAIQGETQDKIITLLMDAGGSY